MKRLFLSTLVAGILSGCASFPEDYQDEIGVPDIVDQYADSWSHEVPLKYVQSASGASISKYFTLPEDVANKDVEIRFNYGVPVTVRDLINALRAQGYKVVSRLGQTEDEELIVRNFSGSLGEFVEELSHSQNIAYEYRNGVLFVLEANRYSVSLPQHEELLNQVAASLTEMGATDVRTDLLAGMVHFEAKPDISDYVTEYLDRIAQNSAMVKLQIAVVTVGLNRDLNLGLDWAQIMATSGTKELRPGVAGRSAAEGNSSTGDYAFGQALSFAGSSGLSYVFNSNTFSLSAAVRALSTYGNARTEQNVVLGTVSGMPVRISSGNDIPYVKSIGSTTASGGSTSGSTQTEIIRSGLDLEVVPNFDSSDNSVVTTVNVKMSSLVGFRELSAGANLGTLSQPEMQNLEFENVGRLQAGETIVIGGITYDQLANNYNNLPGMERMPTGSKAEKINKNAIYIVVRPTVVIFSREADRLNAELAQKEEALRSGQYRQQGSMNVDYNKYNQQVSGSLAVNHVKDPRHVSGKSWGPSDHEPFDIEQRWFPSGGSPTTDRLKGSGRNSTPPTSPTTSALEGVEVFAINPNKGASTGSEGTLLEIDKTE